MTQDQQDDSEQSQSNVLQPQSIQCIKTGDESRKCSKPLECLGACAC